MARKVVGNISRELNQDLSAKTKTGTVERSRRTINPPKAKGIGPYYVVDE